MRSTPMKILVVRNDKLGDFMLAWPALSILKHAYPDAEISVLIPGYTAPIAKICPWIDHIIIDDHRESSLSDAYYMASMLKKQQFDAAIVLFSEFRVALALWLARVPVRVAPATKIFQLFYNHTLVQRRSRSKKPEYIYNVDLVRHFIKLNNDDAATRLQDPPFLSFDTDVVNAIRFRFMSENSISDTDKLVFIHPGCGGSANNLSLQQYADLAKCLSKNSSLHFIVSAGPDELAEASDLSTQLNGIKHTVYHSTCGLVEFAKHIAFADLFISGSTGPLHIAGALNIPTATFYTNRRSASSLRWQTLNNENIRSAFSPAKHHDAEDMDSIDIADACETIRNRFLDSPGNNDAF